MKEPLALDPLMRAHRLDFCVHELETEITSTGTTLFHDHHPLKHFTREQINDPAFPIFPTIIEAIIEVHGINHDPLTTAIVCLESILQQSDPTLHPDAATTLHPIHDEARRTLHQLRSWRRNRFEPLGDPTTLSPTPATPPPPVAASVFGLDPDWDKPKPQPTHPAAHLFPIPYADAESL